MINSLFTQQFNKQTIQKTVMKNEQIQIIDSTELMSEINRSEVDMQIKNSQTIST